MSQKTFKKRKETEINSLPEQPDVPSMDPVLEDVLSSRANVKTVEPTNMALTVPNETALVPYDNPFPERQPIRGTPKIRRVGTTPKLPDTLRIKRSLLYDDLETAPQIVTKKRGLDVLMIENATTPDTVKMDFDPVLEDVLSSRANVEWPEPAEINLTLPTEIEQNQPSDDNSFIETVESQDLENLRSLPFLELTTSRSSTPNSLENLQKVRDYIKDVIDYSNKKESTTEEIVRQIDVVRDKGIDLENILPRLDKKTREKLFDREKEFVAEQESTQPPFSELDDINKQATVKGLLDNLQKSKDAKTETLKTLFKIAELDEELAAELMTAEQLEQYKNTKTSTPLESTYSETNAIKAGRLKRVEKEIKAMEVDNELDERLQRAQERREFLSKPKEERDEIKRVEKLRKEQEEARKKNSIESNVLQRQNEPYVYRKTGKGRFPAFFPSIRRALRPEGQVAATVLRYPRQSSKSYLTPSVIKPTKTQEPTPVAPTVQQNVAKIAVPQTGADFFRYDEDNMESSFVSSVIPESEMALIAENALYKLQQPFYVVFS